MPRAFGFYEAPEHLFSDQLVLYLAGSKDFDHATLARLRESYAALRQSGELYKICREQFRLDCKTCSALKAN